ncbi:MAG: PEGA domain protein [Methanomicrobiales archaeon 53_19]|nr:MAG: PEGA domain protein [Methanomicrobiales archaeon 53_19]
MRHVIWSILLLTLLCGVCSAATLSVEPAGSTCAYEETVNLTVLVGDVSNLGGFDIDLRWNPAVVTLDTKPGNVTLGPLFSGHVNNSAVYTQSGRIRVAAVNATLDGVSGSADLFTVRLKAVDDTGASTSVNLTVNNYGFLNSTSGENITVSSITGATITTEKSNVIDARVAVPSNQVVTGQESHITASVVNRRGVETSALNINVSIVNSDGDLVKFWDSDETISAWGRFQRELAWTPEEPGAYTVRVNVTSDKHVSGTTNSTVTVTAQEYTLEFTDDYVYGPWDGRAAAGSSFYMGTYVSASHTGTIWLNITAPDHVMVEGGRHQTRYLYASDYNYVSVRMQSNTPGLIKEGDIRFDIAANGKTDSLNGTEILIWIPSIRVSSVGATSVGDGKPGELTFNTLHTNNTYDNVTKIIVQSGARGRTLSGLDYLVGYPYGCVEQTTSRMLASLNVKNYYLDRDDKPVDWDNIRERVNSSVSGGVQKLVVGGEKGQNSDGGWSLWGGEPSESSSSSYASYTLARINMPDEDLNRLLVGKITNGSTVDDGTVNFESLIKWFHDNPDNPASGTWTWSAHVCHSWSPESNTAFVMLIHNMINRTVDVQEPYRGYMEDNMKNATRYFVDTQNQDGFWSSGDDKAMATALALWGLEAFALPSDNVTVQQIADAKEKAKTWLIDAQNPDGSWPAGSYYGWYDNGRITESTGYAVLALNATGLTAENATIQEGVNWLIEQYESGGGWGYTWASQVAIDALIHCQPTEVVTGEVKIAIDGEPIVTFMVNATNPRFEHTLTSDQMGTLMAYGRVVRPIEASGGKGEVRSHSLTAAITSGNGPILVSVDHSQSAPVNEIDGKIQGSRLIQSFGYEEEAGLLQVSTDIGILSDAPLVQENSNTYDVGITSTEMVAGEKAGVTITVRSEKENVYSPMIEIPIAGFSFDNASTVLENGERGAFEVLSGTTGNDHPSLFIQSVGWEKNMEMTYEFNITPKDHGALDLDLRIRPLYDDTDVTFANATFTVMGRGNVTVNVVDEDGKPVDAESITLVGANTVADKSSYTFTGILEGTYPLVVNGTGGRPSIHTVARVTPDATALYNFTLPSSLTDPTLVFSEGGAGSIAGVAQVPPEQLNALRNENTTYNVTVLGNGGKIGIALEFPMRYLMNEPVVLVNGDPTEDYKLINGTFTYDVEQQTYSTTNATLIVYNTTAGNNTIEIGFEGGKLGKARSIGEVTTTDALFILQIAIGLERPWDTYDYIDVVDRDSRKITTTDALYVLQQAIGEIRDEYYNVL